MQQVLRAAKSLRDNHHRRPFYLFHAAITVGFSLRARARARLINRSTSHTARWRMEVGGADDHDDQSESDGSVRVPMVLASLSRRRAGAPRHRRSWLRGAASGQTFALVSRWLHRDRARASARRDGSLSSCQLLGRGVVMGQVAPRPQVLRRQGAFSTPVARRLGWNCARLSRSSVTRPRFFAAGGSPPEIEALISASAVGLL